MPEQCLATLEHMGCWCRHLVDIIKEELAERECHAELEVLLLHEVGIGLPRKATLCTSSAPI